MKKKKILIISGAAMLAMFSFAATSMVKGPTYYAAFAEEETNTSEIAEEAAEKTTSKFKQIWETYLLPAVLSINIGSILATVVSISLAIKNYKGRKEYNKEIKRLLELVVGFSKQMVDYSLELAKRNEQVAELVSALKDAKAITEQQIKLIDEENANFEALKKASVALINLEVELAKANPTFVKSGLASQLAEVKSQLLEVVK